MKKLIISVVALVLVAVVWLLVVVLTGLSEKGGEGIPSVVEKEESTLNLKKDQKEIVKLQFEELKSQSTNSRGWTGSMFTDANGVIPLSIGLNALDAHVSPGLLPYLDQGRWAVYSCFNDQNTPEYAIHLKIKFIPNYNGNIYVDVTSRLRDWEPYMLEDVASTIFSNEIENGGKADMGSKQFSVDVRNPEGVRWIPVVLTVSNKVSELVYLMEGDYIVIGNSVSCVDKVIWGLLGDG